MNKTIAKIISQFTTIFSSMRLAVLLLLLLFALTTIGTLYQTTYGLYAAQQRYFYSWFFLIGGFLPFPGAMTVLLLFSINLLVSAYKRYRFKAAKMGIVIIHYGIIFLLMGSLYSFYVGEESFVSLLEGEEVTYSEDYYQSEIIVWKETPTASAAGGSNLESTNYITKIYQSYALNYLEEGTDILFHKFGIRLTPLSYYAHAEPATFFEDDIESISGAKALNFKPLPLKQEEAMPGGIFLLQAPFLSQQQKVLLWEGDRAPYAITNDSSAETYYIMLQRKRKQLPFTIRLKKFVRETYYDSEIPKQFSSEVEIIKGDVSIPALVYMNNPLRIDGYTFFQASFAIEASGSRRSVFATVKNTGYYVPYIASLIIAFGIVSHFLVMAFKRGRKRKGK